MKTILRSLADTVAVFATETAIRLIPDLAAKHMAHAAPVSKPENGVSAASRLDLQARRAKASTKVAAAVL
jgi:hypothetical protein